MGRVEMQEEDAIPSHVLCLAGKAEIFVWPSHISVSLHLSTPRFPHISLPGMSERRRRGRYPVKLPFPYLLQIGGDDEETWEEAKYVMSMRSGVVRHGYFHWRTKRTE